MNDDELIQGIQMRIRGIHDGKQEARTPYPPTTAEEWTRFQDEINSPLPDLLRRFYMDIGDGNWGPWNGLCRLGVRGDEDESHLSVVENWGSDQICAEVHVPDSVSQFSFCAGEPMICSTFGDQNGLIAKENGTVLRQANFIQGWTMKRLRRKDLSFKVV